MIIAAAVLVYRRKPSQDKNATAMLGEPLLGGHGNSNAFEMTDMSHQSSAVIMEEGNARPPQQPASKCSLFVGNWLPSDIFPFVADAGTQVEPITFRDSLTVQHAPPPPQATNNNEPPTQAANKSCNEPDSAMVVLGNTSNNSNSTNTVAAPVAPVEPEVGMSILFLCSPIPRYYSCVQFV